MEASLHVALLFAAPEKGFVTQVFVGTPWSGMDGAIILGISPLSLSRMRSCAIGRNDKGIDV